jgi:hypothetical protein
MELPNNRRWVAVSDELQRAERDYPAFNSAHEGFAVILEEVDELKAEVWKSPKNRNMAAMEREAVQVAAMALRFLRDVCGMDVNPVLPLRPEPTTTTNTND